MKFNKFKGKQNDYFRWNVNLFIYIDIGV